MTHPTEQRGTAPTDVRKRRRAWFARRVAAAPVSLILIGTTAFVTFVALLIPDTIAVLALKAGSGTALSQPYALLSYAFVHASVSHWLFNAVYLLLLGVSIEPEAGAWRVAVGAIAGSLTAGIVAQFVSVGTELQLVVGGTPLVFGVAGLFLGAAPRYWRDWGGVRRVFAGFLVIAVLIGLVGSSNVLIAVMTFSATLAGVAVSLIPGWRAPEAPEAQAAA